MAKRRIAVVGLGMAVTPHAKSLVDLAARAEIAGEREREPRAEIAPARLARAERGGGLGAILEIEQALRMRRHRHAEPDDRDAVLRH